MNEKNSPLDQNAVSENDPVHSGKQAGRPDGRDEEFWFRAEKELQLTRGVRRDHSAPRLAAATRLDLARGGSAAAHSWRGEIAEPASAQSGRE